MDGCIDSDGSDPNGADGDECLVVIVSDQGHEGRGYFAVLSTHPGVGGDFLFIDDYGFPEKIVLAPIPEPVVVADRPGSGGGSRSVEVRVDGGDRSEAHGYFLKCHDKHLPVGYRIYAMRSTDDTPADTSYQSQALKPRFGRKSVPWERVTADPVALGETAVVEVSCSPGEQIRLCATLAFGGVREGAEPFQLLHCSAATKPIPCK